jgi:predicted small secreted protein
MAMKKIIQRFTILILAAVFLVVSATGCRHTAHGAGQDMENMGEKIKDKTS